MAVDSDYSFDKTISFGGMNFTIEGIEGKDYLQLYVEIPSSSGGKWTHTMTNPTSKKALFIYFGDNEKPNYSASGVSSMWLCN